MKKAKLSLEDLTVTETVASATTVATKMTGNASFTTPVPSITDLTALRNAASTLLAERDTLLADARELTVQLGDALALLRDGLTEEANYVDGVAKGDPAIITSAGMAVSDDATPVGEMPKVELLQTTHGDEAGEVDLQWQPIRRGLKSYVIEKSTAPDGSSPWVHAQVETRSRTSVKGLTTGTRYWFRVAGVGAAGQGPWSDIQTKVAP